MSTVPSFSRVVLAALAAAFFGSLTVATLGAFYSSDFRGGAAFGALSLIYTIPAALIIGAPSFYFARKYWPLTRSMVTIVGAASGGIWAAISEFKSVTPTFCLVGTLIGAAGGLLSFPILTRSNKSLQRTA